MSDRCIVQKIFNCLLEDYRTSVLPEVISSWNDLTTEEQSSMSSLKDCIFESLVAPSVYDATAQEILEVLFNAFSSLISHLVADRLPDGKYHNLSAVLTAEVKSVPTTNAISERDLLNLTGFYVRNQMLLLYH